MNTFFVYFNDRWLLVLEYCLYVFSLFCSRFKRCASISKSKHLVYHNLKQNNCDCQCYIVTTKASCLSDQVCSNQSSPISLEFQGTHDCIWRARHVSSKGQKIIKFCQIFSYVDELWKCYCMTEILFIHWNSVCKVVKMIGSIILKSDEIQNHMLEK